MLDGSIVSGASDLFAAHAAGSPADDGAGPLPRAELRDAAATLRYMLAGQAIVTFESAKTGTHFTYRISAADKPAATAPRVRPVSHFVAVLTAPETFVYLGLVREAGACYEHGRKSRVGSAAPSAQAFAWVWARLQEGRMPSTLAVYHEGRCGACGRRLTTPESVASGLGPICAKRAGGAS